MTSTRSSSAPKSTLLPCQGNLASMVGNDSPWRDGRRAVERLRGWSHGSSESPPDLDPDEPLSALADIGLIRRLLDNAELAAVTAARQQHKSWAEIATKLGVTRQSAWERWRDLDDAGGVAGTVVAPGRDRCARCDVCVVGGAIGPRCRASNGELRRGSERHRHVL